MTAPPAGALDIVERLRRCATTMINDDQSEPETRLRQRMVERVEAINDAADALLAALRLREGFYWIKDSDWDQIALEMPLGEDRYAQGYQDAMSAVTRGLCVGPNPVVLPVPPTADDLARVLEEGE